jgi:membrane protease YdiL (CAAX protease family)
MEKNMNWKVILFVVFIIVISLPLFMVQPFTSIDFNKLSFAQFGPTLAYILTIILFKDLFISIKIKISRVIIIKIIFSIIIPFLLYSLTYYIGYLFNIELQMNTNIKNILFNYGIWIIIGAVGEEIGWRSFLQPLLDRKYPIIISSVIIGFIWSLWHINHFINGPIFVFEFLLSKISYSIIIMFLLKNTEYNVFISSMFHASMNISYKIFIENSYGNIRLFLIDGIIWAIFAIIIILCNKEYYTIKTK